MIWYFMENRSASDIEKQKQFMDLRVSKLYLLNPIISKHIFYRITYALK